MAKFNIGDKVICTAWTCEMYNKSGTIINISNQANNDLPYMVQFYNYREWPFAENELKKVDTE
jgi:hypothetical protein